MRLFSSKPAAPPELEPEQDIEQSALDCSWCAAEQRRPTTESPDICTYHAGQIIQQAHERRAERKARR